MHSYIARTAVPTPRSTTAVLHTHNIHCTVHKASLNSPSNQLNAKATTLSLNKTQFHTTFKITFRAVGANKKSDNAPSRISITILKAETNLDIAGVQNIIETVS